jgi:hypothetical protein
MVVSPLPHALGCKRPLCILPIHCIYLFHIVPTINRHCFPAHRWLGCFYGGSLFCVHHEQNVEIFRFVFFILFEHYMIQPTSSSSDVQVVEETAALLSYKYTLHVQKHIQAITNNNSNLWYLSCILTHDDNSPSGLYKNMEKRKTLIEKNTTYKISKTTKHMNDTYVYIYRTLQELNTS